MEHSNLTHLDSTLNLSSFTSFLSKEFNVSDSVFFEHILCMVSMALVHSSTAIEDIHKQFHSDSNRFYDAASQSSCRNNILIRQNLLETEVNLEEALGLLLVAEYDYIIRKEIIHILKNTYPSIFKTVKKHNFKYLLADYKDLQSFIISNSAKYDRAVFLYLSLYCSPDWVDQNLIYAITQTIYEFECYHPIHADFDQELEGDHKAINNLQNVFKEKYGELIPYRRLNVASFEMFRCISDIIENLFYLNKMDINNISIPDNEICQNKVFMSIIKQNSHPLSTEEKITLYISCLYMQALIIEYKEAKAFHFKHNNNTKDQLINKIQQDYQNLQEEKIMLENAYAQIKKENESIKDTINHKIDFTERKHHEEIRTLNSTIQSLQEELNSEKNYRNELNKLREYVFSLDIPITPIESHSKSLSEYLQSKKIIIVGGPRQWRRKLRESFPFIETLSGTSTSFDLSLFSQIDCVLFYTSYMSHSIYNKAMNYIRTNQIKFGYLKSTNIQLLEAELIEVLQQCNIINT